MSYWDDLSNMTVADLEAMGMTLEDFERMLDEGELGGFGQSDYGDVRPPMDISPQATQWSMLDADKTAREVGRPPTPYERRLDRSAYGMNPEAFTYDAVNMSNPYIRALLNTAISGAEPGPNQSFDVREHVFGRYSPDEIEAMGGEGEAKKTGVREGKTRIGQAAREALGDFEYIADSFHADDRRWATTNEKERLALLKDWLKTEAEGALAGAAPSVSRNVNFSDWAVSRQEGEPFGYEGVGFDRAENQKGAPKFQTDERYWGEKATPGQVGQMGLNDFKRAYRDTLAKQLKGPLKPGQRIDDPDMGGYWVVAENPGELTPLQRERLRMRRTEQRRPRGNRRDGGGGRPFLTRVGDTVTAPFKSSTWSSLMRFGR